jgi:hypothetical protein
MITYLTELTEKIAAICPNDEQLLKDLQECIFCLEQARAVPHPAPDAPEIEQALWVSRWMAWTAKSAIRAHRAAMRLAAAKGVVVCEAVLKEYNWLSPESILRAAYICVSGDHGLEQHMTNTYTIAVMDDVKEEEEE